MTFPQQNAEQMRFLTTCSIDAAVERELLQAARDGYNSKTLYVNDQHIHRISEALRKQGYTVTTQIARPSYIIVEW
jgi:hypothetical protein